MSQTRQFLLLAASIAAAAAIFYAAPHHHHAAFAPLLAQLVGHGGCAVRDGRRRKAKAMRFCGKPIKPAKGRGRK